MKTGPHKPGAAMGLGTLGFVRHRAAKGAREGAGTPRAAPSLSPLATVPLQGRNTQHFLETRRIPALCPYCPAQFHFPCADMRIHEEVRSGTKFSWEYLPCQRFVPRVVPARVRLDQCRPDMLQCQQPLLQGLVCVSE